MRSAIGSRSEKPVRTVIVLHRPKELGPPACANGPMRATSSAPVRPYSRSVPFASSAMRANASRSCTAKSARTLRLISTPAFLSPAMKRL
jgi:hypothetical protein